MSPQTRLCIGVFIPYGAQFLDVSPVDIIAMLDPTYLKACKLPTPLVALGVPSTIYYIGLASNTSKHVDLTANAKLSITHTMNDEVVQPGQLDILLIPGPDPSVEIGNDVKGFIKGHAACEHTDILTICTGCYLLAESGSYKGREASAPRALVGELSKKFPNVRWDDSRRWVQDGNLWSSGGITNGQELAAAYLRAKYPSPATEAVLAMADVGEKGAEYTSSTTADGVWWLWQILRATISGSGRKW